MATTPSIIMRGFVGTDPKLFAVHSRTGQSSGCSFRLGASRSYWDAASQQWKARPSTWLPVHCYGVLAQNVAGSIRKGDSVLVSGYLETDEWGEGDDKHSLLVLKAQSMGHDLLFGTSTYRRLRKTQDATTRSYLSIDQLTAPVSPTDSKAQSGVNITQDTCPEDAAELLDEYTTSQEINADGGSNENTANEEKNSVDADFLVGAEAM